ncbi:MAG: hypothetical protein HC889_10490 [Synechococcaceae cyanobacterium SM1_2_3]|nr:hypothetical protein [Synechococcaceae cyanobacterium SM1_2_3]
MLGNRCTRYFRELQNSLRVIYLWWETGKQLWLFTLFDKNEARDLSQWERKKLKEMLKLELEARDD